MDASFSSFTAASVSLDCLSCSLSKRVAVIAAFVFSLATYLISMAFSISEFATELGPLDILSFDILETSLSFWENKYFLFLLLLPKRG